MAATRIRNHPGSICRTEATFPLKYYAGVRDISTFWTRSTAGCWWARWRRLPGFRPLHPSSMCLRQALQSGFRCRKHWRRSTGWMIWESSLPLRAPMREPEEPIGCPPSATLSPCPMCATWIRQGWSSGRCRTVWLRRAMSRRRWSC